MTKHQNQKINVVSHDPNRKKQFSQIKDYIWPSISSDAIAIEHVGSTSVDGLAAKPVIDIDIIVKDQKHSTLVTRSLESLGFEHRGNLGIEGREAFSQLPQFAKHNLYVCLDGSLALENHLNFRNYLSKNPSAVAEYSNLKLELANKTKDICQYIKGKTNYITKILVKTGLSEESLKDITEVNKVK